MTRQSQIDLRELIARVEKCTGPDREIDEAIFAAIEGRPVGYGEVQDGLPPRWTASLDAVIALVEREPSIEGWAICKIDAERYEGSVCRPNEAWEGAQTHHTPALALLLAFLRAKEQT